MAMKPGMDGRTKVEVEVELTETHGVRFLTVLLQSPGEPQTPVSGTMLIKV